MAAKFDPDQVRIPVGHFIGGLKDLPGDEIPVLRPSDHQPLPSIRDGGETVVDQAVEAAKAALKTSRWSQVSPLERARVLHRFASVVEEKADYLARLEALGSSRLYTLTSGRDVLRVAGVIRYYAEFCDKIEGIVTATEADTLSYVRNEPYGVVGAIVPWNFPMITAAWKFAPALAAGNAVVMKTSELTPHSLLALAEIAMEAGLPAGLLNVVNGLGATTGAAIVRHPDIGKISFTGSTATGVTIMQLAAASGTKPVTLELGGKSPQLVFADVADLDKTAAIVSSAVLDNAGQVCTAGSRVLVESRIADALMERMEKRFCSVKAGPTWDDETDFPPIISQKQAERIDWLVQQTLAEGAQLRLGGGLMEGRNAGAYYSPTILEGVDESMTGFNEEFFGPVVIVSRFDDLEEAIAKARHPRYGLAASVHTSDIRKAMRAADAMETGMVWINQHGRSGEFTHPAGGYKESGFGKDMGRAGIMTYLRQKAVWVNYS